MHARRPKATTPTLLFQCLAPLWLHVSMVNHFQWYDNAVSLCESRRLERRARWRRAHNERKEFVWHFACYYSRFSCRASHAETRARVPLRKCKTWTRVVHYEVTENYVRTGVIKSINWYFHVPYTTAELAERGAGDWIRGVFFERTEWCKKTLYHWVWTRERGSWLFGTRNS